MRRLHAALLACGIAVFGASVLPGQDSRPVKLRADPAIKEATETLDKALKHRKAERDAEAASLIQKLGKAWRGGLHAKDEKRVVKSIGRTFRAGPLRPPEAPLYRVAADALALMGDAGARYMQRAYEDRRFPNKREWVPLRAHLLRRMGETKAPAMADFLAERVARSSADDELAAAGEALRHFKDSDQRVRKEIVKEIVSKLGGIEATASGPSSNDPTQPMYGASASAQRTLRVVRKPWLGTLTALTGERHPNGFEWQRWYNKNKARNWDR